MYIYCTFLIFLNQYPEHLEQIAFNSLFSFPETKVLKDLQSESRGRIFFNSLLEKEMATHSSILAWRIPGTVEPGELPSMGSHRLGHD